MEFRKSVHQDIADIMNIVNQAKNYLKQQGVDQWQNGYPNPETIENDINCYSSYVLIKSSKVIGTAAVSFDRERTYNAIYEGNWISNNDEYAVIHRIAVETDSKGQGLASVIIKNVEDMCINKGIRSIKIDTHRENTSMQKLLKKNNFQYCGIIYLTDKSERLAYEKLL